MSNTYDWKRYWYKLGDSPYLFDGFLYVSEYMTSAFDLDSVHSTHCLVLLGEPGMGKSSEVKRIYDAQTEDENTQKLYFNLSSYGEGDRLINTIFQSDVIEKWKNGVGNLYLYLDSLDEALLDIKHLALILIDEIEKLPKERLFLRIACRTAEWSARLSILGDRLKEFWKDENTKALQIAPLRQEDVKLAAETEGIDAEKFVSEIYDKNVTPLAAKPVTLNFLLGAFRKNNSFPTSQTELYEKGCLDLCDENNERRRSANRIGKLNAEKRFKIAARIAALMIFDNKSSIWTGKPTQKEDSDILISELSGYGEINNDDSEFSIDEDSVREVIFHNRFIYF